MPVWPTFSDLDVMSSSKSELESYTSVKKQRKEIQLAFAEEGLFSFSMKFDCLHLDVSLWMWACVTKRCCLWSEMGWTMLHNITWTNNLPVGRDWWGMCLMQHVSKQSSHLFFEWDNTTAYKDFLYDASYGTLSQRTTKQDCDSQLSHEFLLIPASSFLLLQEPWMKGLNGISFIQWFIHCHSVPDLEEGWGIVVGGALIMGNRYFWFGP